MGYKQKLVIARRYRKYIREAKKQQDKCYHAAVEELGIKDTGWAWDYFMNDINEYWKIMFEAGNAKEV